MQIKILFYICNMVRQLLFLLFISPFCYSQNTDSLWKVYNNKTQADTNRLKAIDALAGKCYTNNQDTIITLSEQEVTFAAEINQKKYEANANNNIGVAYMNKGDYPKAIAYQTKAMKL